MHSPAEFLDLIRARYGLPSDYAVAKMLGIDPPLIYRWRGGKGGMSDATAARVAALLDLDPGYVLARLYAERAADDAGREVWLNLARRLGPAVAAVLAVLLLAPLLGLDGSIAWGGALFVMSSLAVAALALALAHLGEAPTRQSAGNRSAGTA